MFRAIQCSSSGGSIVSIHHLVDDCLVCRAWPACQTVIYQSDIRVYQMTYWYNWSSWWWALGCSKHVEKWNKYIENSASSWLLTRITMSMQHWRNDTDREKQKYPDRNLSNYHHSTINLTWSDLGSKPGLRGERPATNLLSHGTAWGLRLTVITFKYS
jgi:hypothetical protein